MGQKKIFEKNNDLKAHGFWISLQSQESQQSQAVLIKHEENKPSHVIAKLLKTKDEEKTLNTAGEIRMHYMSDFTSEKI